jgi:CheY-like chemotaxis protein
VAEAPASASGADRVLVIDAGDALYRMVEREGHQAVHAQDGRAGIEAALRFRPGTVLVDLSVPDGLDIAATLRARQAEIGAKLRLVAVAESGHGDGPRIAAAGFDALMVKPVDSVALKRALGPA